MTRLGPRHVLPDVRHEDHGRTLASSVSGSGDRPTIPADLRGLARESEREFETASSDVRPLMPLHAVPWLIMTLDQVKALPLDARAGRLLSLVDGRATIDEVGDAIDERLGALVW